MTCSPLCLTLLRWLLPAQTFRRALSTPNPRQNSQTPPAEPSPLTKISGIRFDLPSKTHILFSDYTHFLRVIIENAKAISYSPAQRSLC